MTDTTVPPPRLHPRLAQILDLARDQHATDVFLVAGEPPLLRLAGSLSRLDEAALTEAETHAIAAAALGEDRLAAIGPEIGSAYVAIPLEGGDTAALSAARAGGRVSITARLIEGALFDVARLEVPDAVVRAMDGPNGVVIVTGPSGSGKTSVCYALLEHLNQTRDVHLVTCEYFVEYLLEPKRALIQQRQIGLDAPDMLAGIRSALLQDLDALFVAEVRDLAVLSGLVSTAETGHLVLTALHQPSPTKVIGRMIELQPNDSREAFSRALASTLRAVVAPRLLPRKDGGTVTVYSVLIPDDTMRQAIRDGNCATDRPDDLPLPEGCQTFAEHIDRLEQQGIIDATHAERGRTTFVE